MYETFRVQFKNLHSMFTQRNQACHFEFEHSKYCYNIVLRNTRIDGVINLTELLVIIMNVIRIWIDVRFILLVCEISKGYGRADRKSGVDTYA